MAVNDLDRLPEGYLGRVPAAVLGERDAETLEGIDDGPLLALYDDRTCPCVSSLQCDVCIASWAALLERAARLLSQLSHPATRAAWN